MPFRLIWRNILAHPLRSLLTFGSVLVAVFLLCVLNATNTALTSTVEKAATNRLWTQSAVSLFVGLPLSYEPKISAVEGVEAVCKWQWFGGYYREPSNFFAQFGIDSGTLFESYPELEIVDGSYAAFEQDRTGCMIGADLAASYGWKIGDRVPIVGTIYPRSDGSTWDYTVRGIYRSKTTRIDQNTLYFHHDYLRESLESGDASGTPGYIGVYMLRIAPGARAEQVMADVDGLFENGPQRVRTTTEGEFNRQFIGMLGSVPTLLSMIGGAVLFAIFFAVLNTMLMAARERVRDVGIMKALGFGNGKIWLTLILEALLVCASGGLIGVGLALWMEPGVARFLTNTSIPGFELDGATIVLGIALAVGLGLIAGALAGWRSARMVPVRALRAEA